MQRLAMTRERENPIARPSTFSQIISWKENKVGLKKNPTNMESSSFTLHLMILMESRIRTLVRGGHLKANQDVITFQFIIFDEINNMIQFLDEGVTLTHQWCSINLKEGGYSVSGRANGINDGSSWDTGFVDLGDPCKETCNKKYNYFHITQNRSEINM